MNRNYFLLVLFFLDLASLIDRAFVSGVPPFMGALLTSSLLGVRSNSTALQTPVPLNESFAPAAYWARSKADFMDQ